ncbi:hypothetical protein RhiirC2_734571 [Rhizophagus irregularis]|uniref:Transmembrane protein n=1 Tax=Rhizophagus irregularis TaxID=588596 RepID=A0A2N1NQV0_9GLOM|nr:hypothetical protein RhiirC2_734571 [Rhizophagus irregularis]
MNENDIINEENIPIRNQQLKLNFKNIFFIIISLIIAMFAVNYQYMLNFKSPATDLSSTDLSLEQFEFNFDESEKLEEIEQESNSFEILPVECFNTICDCPESKEETKKKNIKKKSTKRPTKQSTKQSEKKPTKQSTKRSTKQSKKPTKRSTKRSIKRSMKNKSKKQGRISQIMRKFIRYM